MEHIPRVSREQRNKQALRVQGAVFTGEELFDVISPPAVHPSPQQIDALVELIQDLCNEEGMRTNDYSEGSRKLTTESHQEIAISTNAFPYKDESDPLRNALVTIENFKRGTTTTLLGRDLMRPGSYEFMDTCWVDAETNRAVIYRTLYPVTSQKQPVLSSTKFATRKELNAAVAAVADGAAKDLILGDFKGDIVPVGKQSKFKKAAAYILGPFKKTGWPYS
jgi:hypothetical protein